jgi:predicted RNase H-like HicB family nuclease
VRLKVILEPSDEGGFTAYVPALPGCISEGETTEEALANIREAIELYLEPVADDWAAEEGALVEQVELRIGSCNWCNDSMANG